MWVSEQGVGAAKFKLANKLGVLVILKGQLKTLSVEILFDYFLQNSENEIQTLSQLFLRHS